MMLTLTYLATNQSEECCQLKKYSQPRSWDFCCIWQKFLGLKPGSGEGNGTPLQYSCWKIPWKEEPGGLLSMGSHRVGHDWATSLSLFTFMHWRRKWQPTAVFLPRKSHGQRSLTDYSPWGRKVWTRLSTKSRTPLSDWAELNCVTNTHT